MYLLHAPLGREERSGEAYARRRAPEAIVGKLPHEPGSLDERPGWAAAVVGAGSAQLLTLDQDDLGP